jgi:hypothetical protein
VAVEHSGDAKAHRRGRQPGAHVAE